ncbi:hypothetical protein NXG27_07260 [Megasphaera paucivorans]|uniref:Uncharacterized protein n=1 Tax=Megasphaera paucivorans TaxID=349095 RepID=A0A1G9WZW5_9FIRM|nr:hypothetical protein [Megasphaera paucivorans]SDM90114.1 hypothetical protein SAMN05660299_01728 [Megasphaera paucivorans]
MINFNESEYQQEEMKYYAVIGNNGLCIVDNEYMLLQAVRKLFKITIWEFDDLTQANQYAVSAYITRYMMLYRPTQQIPCLPERLTLNQLYFNPDFDNEGQRDTLLLPGVSL